MCYWNFLFWLQCCKLWRSHVLTRPPLITLCLILLFVFCSAAGPPTGIQWAVQLLLEESTAGWYSALVVSLKSFFSFASLSHFSVSSSRLAGLLVEQLSERHESFNGHTCKERLHHTLNWTTMKVGPLPSTSVHPAWEGAVATLHESQTNDVDW